MEHLPGRKGAGRPAAKRRTGTQRPSPTGPRAARHVGPGSLGERVYAMIKQDIITSVLAPGITFSEAQLSQRYAVSKAPVRWALAALSRERLVSARPRQGYTVAPLTVQSVRELYDLRLILEPAAARLAAGRADIALLTKLHDQVCRGYVIGDQRSERHWIEANKAFHVEIARASGNDRLARLITVTLDETDRILHAGLSIPDGTKTMRPDHQGLIDALANGDAEAAARMAAIHVENSRRLVMDAILATAVIQQANVAARPVASP
jgi:DNA-binding GntR family transcriptional regulator